MEPVLSIDELKDFMTKAFPQQFEGRTSPTSIEKVGAGFATCRLQFHDRHLRPGGTISGPAMMALADTAMYVVTLAHIGLVPLAVTTNLNINFLRKPAPKDLIATAKLLKLGKSLAVGEVTLHSDEADKPVAHATVTYSIPPKR